VPLVVSKNQLRKRGVLKRRPPRASLLLVGSPAVRLPFRKRIGAVFNRLRLRTSHFATTSSADSPASGGTRLHPIIHPWYRIAIHGVAACDIPCRASKMGVTHRMKRDTRPLLSTSRRTRTCQAPSLAANLFSFHGEYINGFSFTSYTYSNRLSVFHALTSFPSPSSLYRRSCWKISSH
jgi:hypothetical protein